MVLHLGTWLFYITTQCLDFLITKLMSVIPINLALFLACPLFFGAAQNLGFPDGGAKNILVSHLLGRFLAHPFVGQSQAKDHQAHFFRVKLRLINGTSVYGQTHNMMTHVSLAWAQIKKMPNMQLMVAAAVPTCNSPTMSKMSKMPHPFPFPQTQIPKAPNLTCINQCQRA